MMKLQTLFTIVVAVGFLGVSGASAQEAETIDHVTDDNVIVLQNGTAYQSQDTTSSTWSSGDEVLILDDEKIVNKDENEAVDVTETSNPDDDVDDPNLL